MKKRIIVAPSVLSADFARLGEEVNAVVAAGADWIHVDVMDGRFVPNLTIGPVVVEAVRHVTSKPLDVHLMIVEPERYLDAFAHAGADHLLVHCEPGSTIHLHRTLSQIRDLGKVAGVVLNPGTSLTQIDEVLDLCDIILLMSVTPALAARAFCPRSCRKSARCGNCVTRAGSIQSSRSIAGSAAAMPGRSSTLAPRRSSRGQRYSARPITPRRSWRSASPRRRGARTNGGSPRVETRRRGTRR